MTKGVIAEDAVTEMDRPGAVRELDRRKSGEATDEKIWKALSGALSAPRMEHSPRAP